MNNDMKHYKELLILLILLITFLLCSSQVFAYDLILPKEKKSIVNTQYAFFVGKVRKSESFAINDERVYIAPNGAFAHSVKLKNGENRIVLHSNFSRQVYKIYKETPCNIEKPSTNEFEPTWYVVTKDNTPLRSTPIDYGMNRISHLFEGTNLVINGEKGDFYRVRLSKNKEAWIMKSHVRKVCADIFEPQFVTMDSQTFKNATIHTLEFTEKLPYTIDENDKEIIFKVYNPFVEDNSTYTVNVKKPEKYVYKTILANGKYQFKINALPEPENKTLEGLTIVVDAGHGGSEKGAIGCLGDKEKDLNLKIALELKELLSLMGAKVIMTRECDANVSLDERVKIAHDNEADMFISIHLNSIPDICMNVHKNRGTSVYYYNKNSKRLAQIVEKTVTEGLGTRKDGTRTASFAVIRPTDYVGILVETAYMTNPIDSVIYSEENFPRKTAKLIAEAVSAYVMEE